MLNLIQPGSYIRPHSHKANKKLESIIVIHGGICYMTFDKLGNILSFNNLCANTNFFEVDSEPNVIHDFFAIKENTVLFQVKSGPYIN
jgi:cupin fold WbuC family metalloprotein